MWDDRYSQSEYFYGKNPNTFLTVAAGLVPKSAVVLCLAEGEGRNAVYLASLGLNVAAVDFSAVAKEKALALATSKNVHIKYLLSDLNEFIFPTNLDAVVSIWCHLPKNLRQTIHRQTEESLVSGGIFILEAYNPKQLEFKTGGPSTVDLLYTEEDIRNDFQHMEWILAQETLQNIKEGTGHSGMSSTLQMIGKKR